MMVLREGIAGVLHPRRSEMTSTNRSEPAGPDPVHPGLGNPSATLSHAVGDEHHVGADYMGADSTAKTRGDGKPLAPPLARDLGVPAILLNQVVALEVG